jgi:4'-phosphopantetheinyl transferase EntD
MLAGSIDASIAVALATVDELPAAARALPDAERRAARIAAHRAIRSIAGDRGTIELRRRSNRPPLAWVRNGDTAYRTVALALTHRDGHAAAIAAAAGARVGIDLERIDTIDPARERFFLTARERRAASGVAASVLWTLKEAVWKALELDPRVGFHELELDANDAGDVRGAVCRGVSYRAASTIACPWAGYVMATVRLELDR